jgi:hypothetical protein
MIADVSTEVKPGLTKEDLAFLRKCDRVSFHTVKGASHVLGTIEGKTRGRVTTAEQKITVDVPHHVRQYGVESSERIPDDRIKCFSMLSGYELELKTMLAHLRPGDELRLMWMRDTRDIADRSNGFHVDEFAVEVKRGGELMFRYKLDEFVGPDNSARMIQWYRTW